MKSNIKKNEISQPLVFFYPSSPHEPSLVHTLLIYHIITNCIFNYKTDPLQSGNC